MRLRLIKRKYKIKEIFSIMDLLSQKRRKQHCKISNNTSSNFKFTRYNKIEQPLCKMDFKTKCLLNINDISMEIRGRCLIDVKAQNINNIYISIRFISSSSLSIINRLQQYQNLSAHRARFQTCTNFQ